MSQFKLITSFSAVTIVFCLLTMTHTGSAEDSDSQRLGAPWTDSFDISDCALATAGVNRFFKLLPNYQLMLEGKEGTDSVTLVVTVRNRTDTVDGVATRVVEEREAVNGELVEVSRNFFAFCQNTGSVFYFGEDVDEYKDDQIVGHSGSWRAGHSGFRPGLMMPGLALNGASYYQEYAPGIAMDRARIITTDTTFTTPAGVFEHCLVVEETSALEPHALEYKIYAPGVGLIKDGSLLLTSHGMIDE